MTSGNFEIIDPNLITVDKENRQRKDLGDIQELADSIQTIGLINPIVVDENYNLVAGERRLTACLSLGFQAIPVQFVEGLEPEDLQLIELEENAKRKALSWQEHVDAVVKYHELRKQANPDWQQKQTADALSMSESPVARCLLINEHLDHEMVKSADKLSVAFGAAKRLQDRATASTQSALDTAIDTVLPTTPTTDPEPHTTRPENRPPPADIMNVSALEWMPNYKGPKFNLIHCDFPYGINTGDKQGQKVAASTGAYEDSPDIYFELLNSFVEHGPKFIADSAHLVFWFSMNYYDLTKKALEQGGWHVETHPLIWHKSDNSGILPDPQRGPRRTYETALFCRKGDRKIVKAVSNSIGAPVTRELHTSEKSLFMLEHFGRMLIDEYSRCLDPTAGSGNFIKTAVKLGAEYALGLELNPDYAEAARKNVTGYEDES